MDKVNIFYRVVSDQLQILRLNIVPWTVTNFVCSNSIVQTPNVRIGG